MKFNGNLKFATEIWNIDVILLSDRPLDWAYECNVRYASTNKKNRQFLLFSPHHNLPTNCTNAAKCLSLMQNLLGILMQLTELCYYMYN